MGASKLACTLPGKTSASDPGATVGFTVTTEAAAVIAICRLSASRAPTRLTMPQTASAIAMASAIHPYRRKRASEIGAGGECGGAGILALRGGATPAATQPGRAFGHESP